MKKILVLTLVGLFAISLISAELPFKLPERDYTEEEQFCINNGHQPYCRTYNFRKYCWCRDNYGNECELDRYFSGECELKDEWTRKDDKMVRLSEKKNFEKKITKCKKDSQCYSVQEQKCPIYKAVNKKGVKYYNWWQNTYALGHFMCLAVVDPTQMMEPKCVNKRCVLQ